MKRNSFIVLICIASILSMCGCSIYIPRLMPEEGIWYCEELKMSIDFSMIEQFEPDCIKQYSDDGTYTILRCLIDYDNSINICSLDEETRYFNGDFKYKDDTFIYKTDDDTFYFKEVKDTDANLDFIVREPGFTTQSGAYVRTDAGHDAMVYEWDDGSVHLIFLTHQTKEDAFDKFETGDTIYIKFVLLNSEGELEYAEVFDCYEEGRPKEVPEEYIEKLNSMDVAWTEIISQ